MKQGDVWWVNLPGHENRQPVLVVQRNAFNESRLETAVCVLLTPHWDLAQAPGNTIITTADSGLPRAAVANVAHLLTLSKSQFSEYISTVSPLILETVLDGIQFILGR